MFEGEFLLYTIYLFSYKDDDGDGDGDEDERLMFDNFFFFNYLIYIVIREMVNKNEG